MTRLGLTDPVGTTDSPVNVKTAILLSVLSGVLLTVGLPSSNLGFLSWMALVPLFLALRGRNAKDAFRLGYICGMVHFLTTLYWIRYVVNYYGGLPLPVAILLLILLCAYLALYPALFALVAHRWEGYPRLWVWGLPAVWVTLEWFRAYALTGFPWANLGYTQSRYIHLIQVADITGVYGLSWLIVFANTCVMSYVNRLRYYGATAFLILCLVGAGIYGAWRLDTVDRLQAQSDPIHVGVLQGNIDQSIKWDPAIQQETLRKYLKLSLDAADHNPRPELLVWPETAAPFLFGIKPMLTMQLQEIVRHTGIPAFFGSPGIELVGEVQRYLNKAYLLDENGDVLGQYAKQHLVPFGEYVPLKEILFFVHQLVEATGDFMAGQDPSPLAWEDQRLGVLICYESIFPALSRKTVSRGATLLVNITNDAWFGMSSAPYQHLDMAMWRAVEFRTPLIRAANTGISAIFDAAGRECGTLPMNVQGFLVCPVRPVPVTTLYEQFGDFFAWMCVGISLAALALTAGSMRSKKNDALQ